MGGAEPHLPSRPSLSASLYSDPFLDLSLSQAPGIRHQRGSLPFLVFFSLRWDSSVQNRASVPCPCSALVPSPGWVQAVMAPTGPGLQPSA